MKIELFDARALRPLAGYLEHNGVKAQSVLDHARIPEELTAQGGWVTKKQAYDFTWEVVQTSRTKGAIFAAYQDFELADLGPITGAMKSCKTVKEALELATRLGNIAYEGSEYFLQTVGEITWFCYRETQVISQGQQFINDMTLAVYWHLVRFAANEDWSPKRMLIRGQSIDRHRSMPCFEGCRASAHAAYSGLAFPTEFLSRRTPWQPQTNEFDEKKAWLFHPEDSPPIVDTLYRLLASQFAFRKLPTLDQVASTAGCSPATLKHLLQSSGMSYTGVLDRLRFDAACDMLSIPQVSVKEVAHELGYSGSNNFVRSFRRMTGMTPSQYRQSRLDQ